MWTRSEEMKIQSGRHRGRSLKVGGTMKYMHCAEKYNDLIFLFFKLENTGHVFVCKMLENSGS